MEREELEKLAEGGFSIREISKMVNLSFTSVRYWLSKYKIKTKGKKSKDNWTEENLKLALENSECKIDVFRFLEISPSAGNYKTLKKYLKKYSIDESSIRYKYDRGNKWNKKYSNSEVFCKNSTFTATRLKQRILEDDLLSYKCDICGNLGEWNNKELVLQIDHINGDNSDAVIENLRFLCPNCHSQTETFSMGGKRLVEKQKKIKQITK